LKWESFVHDVFKFNPSNPDEHGKLHDPYRAMTDYCRETGKRYFILGKYPEVEPEECVGMII